MDGSTAWTYFHRLLYLVFFAALAVQICRSVAKVRAKDVLTAARTESTDEVDVPEVTLCQSFADDHEANVVGSLEELYALNANVTEMIPIAAVGDLWRYNKVIL